MAFNDAILPKLEGFVGGELTGGENALAEALANTGPEGLAHYPHVASVATAIYSARQQRKAADIVSDAVDRLEKASQRSTDRLTMATWVLALVAIVQVAVTIAGLIGASH